MNIQNNLSIYFVLIFFYSKSNIKTRGIDQKYYILPTMHTPHKINFFLFLNKMQIILFWLYEYKRD